MYSTRMLLYQLGDSSVLVDVHYARSTSVVCHLLQVCIELAGCTVQAITDAIPGKTPWFRKAPLLLIHPTRTIYNGATRVLMFCMDSHSKEQMYIALNTASSPDAVPHAKLESEYAAYCTALIADAKAPYPMLKEYVAEWMIYSSSGGHGAGGPTEGKGRARSRLRSNVWHSSFCS